ncbi:hypothetical protein B0H19DRAFT_1138736 [Mycena capillaripes]|nr:hypothetical protein B0H19DRAFT_1138736 [Mycena capillaripes]
MDGSLASLPNELVIHILHIDPNATQVARSLTGTCKRFHDLSVPFLFRSVRLHTQNDAIKFFSAVMSKPSRAEHVRSLIMSLGRGFRRDTPHRQNWKVSEALKLMSNLEHLTFNFLMIDAVDYHNILQRHTFPRLISCELDVPGRFMKSTHDYDLLAAFWERHQTLTHLYCQDLMQATGPSQPISMLNLEYLEASPVLAPLLVCRRLREVRLVWYPWQTSLIEHVLVGLKSMTGSHIPFVASFDFFGLDACEAILDSTARNIPQTHILRMRRIGQYNELEALDNEFISRITEHLSKFTDLMNATDRILVETWGHACPTLAACCLNSLAWIKLDGRWNAASLDNFYALVDVMHMKIRMPIRIQM